MACKPPSAANPRLAGEGLRSLTQGKRVKKAGFKPVLNALGFHDGGVTGFSRQL
jgi:hypothetical protein